MKIESLYTLYKEYPVICTDTRKITPNCIFFALRGESFNANLFAKLAIENGAAYAVIDEAEFAENERFIVVENVLEALQGLAKYHRSLLTIPFLGITGTNGKTTTKELINSVLSEKFNTHATVGNLNNHIGVPLTILAIDSRIEFAIIEMGANHQKEIKLLADIANPEFGIITNVGKAHLEGFGGFEGVKKGKKELYDHIAANRGLIFINHDNELLIGMATNNENRIYYGTGPDNFVEGKKLNKGETVSLEWRSAESNTWHEVNANLVGSYNFENVLAAICIGHYFNLSPDEIKTGVEKYYPTNSRSQSVKTQHNTLICDYYNANPSSMSASIENFAKIPAGRKQVILADMFELGEYSEEEHRKVLNLLKEKGLKNAVLIGKHFSSVKNDSDYMFFESTAEAEKYLINNPVKDAIVLVKGSRGMKLETLINHL